jgi:hypothetical protein
MGALERSSLPSDLVEARHRFQAWREQRTGRDRIPRALWALAVRLTRTHGVSRTASALGLDYYSLKERAEAATSGPPANPPAFVELPSPVVARTGVFEFDDGAGVTMRVHLVGYDAADVEALARGFWGNR